MILKAACMNNPCYIDRLITSFMRVLQRMAREHLTPSTPDHSNIASELLILSLDLIKNRVGAMTLDMRKAFIGTILVGLIDKTQDAKVMKAIMKMVEDWVMTKVCCVPRLFLIKGHSVITQCRSVAKSVGCFQRRLFVCVFVCQHNHFQTSKHGMMKLVHKSQPSSNVGVEAPWLRTPQKCGLWLRLWKHQRRLCSSFIHSFSHSCVWPYILSFALLVLIT